MNIIVFDKDAFTDRLKVCIRARDQVKHLTDVLNVSPGDCVRVGQLNGKLGQARVCDICDDQVVFDQLSLDTAPPKKLGLTLVVSMPRPKALRRLVADATSMGVDQIIIIHSYRVEKSYWQSPLLTRLDDFIRLGLEQAGDTIPPKISLKKRFKPFVEDDLPTIVKGRNALVLDKSGVLISARHVKHAQSVLVFGAEGGFIPYELNLLADQGCTQVSIGSRVLRTETAIAHTLGWLSAIG